MELIIHLLSTSDDVLTEQAVLKWYNGAHVAKGKSVFLAQMKPMVDWLLTDEEESEEDEEKSMDVTTSSTELEKGELLPNIVILYEI